MAISSGFAEICKWYILAVCAVAITAGTFFLITWFIFSCYIWSWSPEVDIPVIGKVDLGGTPDIWTWLCMMPLWAMLCTAGWAVLGGFICFMDRPKFWMYWTFLALISCTILFEFIGDFILGYAQDDDQSFGVSWRQLFVLNPFESAPAQLQRIMLGNDNLDHNVRDQIHKSLSFAMNFTFRTWMFIIYMICEILIRGACIAAMVIRMIYQKQEEKEQESSKIASENGYTTEYKRDSQVYSYAPQTTSPLSGGNTFGQPQADAVPPPSADDAPTASPQADPITVV